MKIIFTLMLSILFISPTTFADGHGKKVKLNIKQKKKFKYWEKELAKFEKRIEKDCGVKIPITMDKAVTPVFLSKNISASSYCEEVARPLLSFCKDADIKADVLKAIKSVHCGMTDANKATFKLDGTKYIGMFGTGVSNLSNKSKDWLENNL